MRLILYKTTKAMIKVMILKEKMVSKSSIKQLFIVVYTSFRWGKL